MYEGTTDLNVSNKQRKLTIDDLHEILTFDKDKNGFPKLTDRNVALIEFIINNDSNYRALDDSDGDSISQTIIGFNDSTDIEKIEKIGKIINKD